MSEARAALGYAVYCLLVPGLLAIAIPTILVEAGHRPFRIGAIIAAQNAGMALAPVWGYVAERYRRLEGGLTASLVIMAAALLAIGTQRSLSGLMLANVLLGIGGGGAATISGSSVGGSGTGPLATRFARLQAAGAVATLVGFALGGWVPARRSVLASALGLAILAARGGGRRPRAARPNDAAADPAACGPDGRRGERRTPATGQFLLLLALWFVFSSATAAFASQYPIAMRTLFAAPVHRSATALALGAVLGLPAYAASAIWIARLGAPAVLAIGVAIRGASLATLCAAPATLRLDWLPLVAAGLWQAAWPMIGVAAMQLAIATGPRNRGLSLGAMTALGAASSALGALVGGWIADRFGYGLALEGAALFTAAAAPIALALRVTADV